MLRLKIDSIRSIYLYAVSFATLLMIIFSIVGMVQNAILMMFPDPVYSPGPLEIRQRYQEMLKNNPENITEELIKEQVQFETARSEHSRLRARIRDLARNIALLAVAIPIYLYHWRRAQNENRVVASAGEQGLAQDNSI